MSKLKVKCLSCHKENLALIDDYEGIQVRVITKDGKHHPYWYCPNHCGFTWPEQYEKDFEKLKNHLKEHSLSNQEKSQ